MSTFEEAYHTLRAYALRVANRRCFDRVRAAEFADEGMLRLWKSWARVADRPESERRTWLSAIVRNLIIDDLRKARPALPSFSLDASFDMPVVPEVDDDAADILMPLLRRAWPNLSLRQRAFVEASLNYDGPSWGAGPILAATLGITSEAQKKLKQRTMGVLRAAA